jgi:alpha-tubulin suppressor-like RCC1 family protein
MATERVNVASNPRSIASYVKKNAEHVKKAQKPMHGKMESVRQAEYKGHHIVVRTRYQIEVDGQMLMGHMGVTNDGQVHYHPVPNLSFASAIDLVKQLIDIFPDDFGKKGRSHMHGMKTDQHGKSQK